jgi:hypothetical protein
MKATLLSFVFNNFWESGLFNALRLIQIKKIAPFPNSRPRLSQGLPEDIANPTSRPGVSFGLRKCILRISGFVNRLLLAEGRS